jgi:hypothetical protein
VPNGEGIKVDNTDYKSELSFLESVVNKLNSDFSKADVPSAETIQAQPIMEFGGISSADSGSCNYPCDIISGNSGAGLSLNNSAKGGSKTSADQESYVAGSLFGVSATGEPLPNGGPDISITGVDDANPLRVGGNTNEGNVLSAMGSPAVSVTAVAPTSLTPPVALLGNTYIEEGSKPPIVGPLHPGAPQLEKVDIDGPNLQVRGYVSKGERLEFYSSSSCGGERFSADYVTVKDLGDFFVTLNLKDFGGRPYISAIGTDASNRSSKFSDSCLLIPS